MPSPTQIHTFTTKWISKYQHPEREREAFYADMAKDCEALGFQMDCGKAFTEKYDGAGVSPEALEEVIDDVDDIALLGSAIYSKWRHLTYWIGGEAILKTENRRWFVIALERLEMLADILPANEQDPFQGKIQKIKIISNAMRYDPAPKQGDEIEQHLSIIKDGRVFFSSYAYDKETDKPQKNITKNFKTDIINIKRITSAFERHFSKERFFSSLTDCGGWTMELTNTGGEVYKFQASFAEEFSDEGMDISEWVREQLDMSNLYVFDGKSRPDPIQMIKIEYKRTTKTELPKPPGGKTRYEKETYAETLLIDSEAETLEHVRKFGEGYTSSRKYHMPKEIPFLLEKLNTYNLFKNVAGDTSKTMHDPLNKTEYTITVDYNKMPGKVINGTFDRNGLPDDFPEFIEMVRIFMDSYGPAEILDPSMYKKALRKEDDVIFCSVIFDKNGKSYSYITDDDSLKVGDMVTVPVGYDGHKAVVRIVDIRYFAPDEAPIPLDKVKKIIGRY